MTWSGRRGAAMPDREPPPADIVLLSTADWDHPAWTNKQHVAVELARSGRRVLYVDSLGLRPPALSGRDLRRMLRRVGLALRPPRQVRPGLWVWSPLRLPGQGRPGIRRLNRAALALGLRLACRYAGLRPDVLWTYSPLTCELLHVRRFARTVYHAVDEVAAQPGMPAALIRRAEHRLARVADLVFVTAPALQRRLTEAGARRCVLTPNVADPDHFAAALDPGTRPPEDIAGLPGPRIGFVGALSPYKVDVGLLAAVAGLRPHYTFVLIGQVGEGQPGADVAALRGLPNVHLLGPRPYAALPGCLAGIDVAILPAPANDYTAAMFPMKFFEYLAAGRPVVATPLPALQAFAHLALVAPREPAAFAAALDRALAGEGSALDARLQAARAHTYARRTRDMLVALAALDGFQSA
jgi:glycosyltransferase involved in cell wall biosynthesis